jgi:hypothetical protein
MGLPALAGAWGRYMGFYLGYGNIWKTQTNNGRQKYSAVPITLSHKCGTLQMRIAVSRE